MRFRERFFWFDETDAPLPDGEIVVDCFAGGGGASTGIKRGCGRAPHIAINHDKAAVAMHKANHPERETRHYCENIFDVNPEEITEGRPIGLAWFSPDCTDHSKAKGSRPRSKKLRALAWIVIRWAARKRPRIIMLENVEEFVDWGPLKGNQRDPRRKGQTFQQWVAKLVELGYVVEWRNLVASDYGSPTTRKRLFVIARCDGEPIVWPDPTHGSPKTIAKQLRKNGVCRLQTWRTAAEIIDWTIPCPSIFCTKAEAKAEGLTVQRPLREKTLRRIAEGIRRYVIETAEPFIVRVDHGGEHFRGQSAGRPLSTITQRHGFGVVTPFVAALQQGGSLREICRPLHTVTASRKDCNLLVTPTLVQTGYGERQGQAPRCLDLDQPLGTIVAGGGKHALVSAFIAKHFGGVTGVEVLRPFPTITTVGTQNQLVAATLVKNNHGDKQAFDIREPLRTIVAGGKHHALVQCRVEQVRAFLIKYYGSGGQWGSLHNPLSTITVKDRLCLGIVLVGGEPYQIVDIGMRMLTPRELFNAQGFDSGYVIDVGINGKPATKGEMVGRCGNSVPPHPVAALVSANYRPCTSRPATHRTAAVAAVQ